MFSLHDLQDPSKHRVTAKRCDNLWNCWIPSPCQLMPALFLRARGLERQFFFHPNFSSAWCLVLHKKSHVWDKSLAGIHGLCPSCLGSHGSRANSKQTAESDVTNLGIYPGLNNRCMFYCCLFHCFSFYSFPCPCQSYPFVAALSPDHWVVPLMQTVDAEPLLWAAGGSAKEFWPSDFGIFSVHPPQLQFYLQHPPILHHLPQKCQKSLSTSTLGMQNDVMSFLPSVGLQLSQALKYVLIWLFKN